MRHKCLKDFMKCLRKILFLFLVLSVVFAPASRAELPTFDAANALLNQIRNALMQSQFAQDIGVALEHLTELKTQTLELFRFHSGFDDIVHSLIGDPLKNLVHQGPSVRDLFIDAGLITPDIQIGNGQGGPQDILASLETISGKIPETDAKPYLAFEEMQIVDAFHLANQIRAAGTRTRESANQIAEEAMSASPKGAARLQAQGVSQLMLLQQQNQEATAKLLELGATQIEQVHREEKRLETERAKFLDDSRSFANEVVALYGGELR